MPSYAVSYLVFALVFGALDFVWLSLAAPALYRPAIGPLLADKVRVAPAVLFYLVYVAGVVGFVVAPALAAVDWRQAVLRGAAFGFVAYATYDLTNQATLKLWPTRITAVDLTWGTLATAAAAGVTVVVAARLAKALGWN
jgi:uncharacterized membrane protein